ncbi:molecular chaperone, DnaJ superfamily [Heterobasidion irregulare TC 32-1]|uniref:Molecular chaperone, DnaJ superfamily n=1 Tax=Heterobasidion irregulare (strain TC 32-1) TaxID=747525 RepID=W4KFF7_HETIT|nr:molecular chaperone, DnaJ superfamily [Heterobasidion irregulare TC 32-1]ETW84592.1 molecular chaperone, DnaJ superfamily [Heterobasidion irregulare TC 32-1]
MASYNYDESGNMALYFIITVLSIILVPFTLSFLFSSSSKHVITSGCECGPCVRHRKEAKGSSLRPKLSRKAIFTALGWAALALLSYKVANTANDSKIYDPYEILGLTMGVTEKDIKSHFKKLSRIYHPDKVKLTANDTAESVASRFVDITKAYKSLTDANIRKNYEDYGHPDGRQEITMGIALPRWIVEAQNNIWVLGVYGLLFGVSLPMLVGRWWFGSRQKTKDGIHAQTASRFFKSLTEASGIEDIVGALGKAVEFERPGKPSGVAELEELEKAIEAAIGQKWRDVRALVKSESKDGRWRALVLIHAYLLRLDVKDSALKKEQVEILLQTPNILNALLNISMARNWFLPTLAVMHLHAYLAQALFPGNDKAKYVQLPGISEDDVETLPEGVSTLEDYIQALEEKGDERLPDIKKAAARWGRLELVDARFQVIGERIVTPSALVLLVVKLRISPPTHGSLVNGATKDEEERPLSDTDAAKDDEFLKSPQDYEDLSPSSQGSGWAHAPYWPGNRRPGWWIVIADEKMNKVVVPPMKISDIPFSDPTRSRNFRSFKLRFQAPPGVGLFTWRIHIVSDTLIGEDIVKAVQLKIDDVSALNEDEQDAEDEISEPEEDTLAGQMAAMRGGSVKKAAVESDDESSTDDDNAENSDSSSDSD